MSLEDCSCLDFAKREAVSEFPYLGLCEEQCQKVLLFIALTSLMGFITRTTTVGHTIVGLSLHPLPHLVRRHLRLVLPGVGGQVRPAGSVLDLRHPEVALRLPRIVFGHPLAGGCLRGDDGVPQCSAAGLLR